ncbi:MAG: DUF5063 domain-containing protein [Tannerella sp.]|jgi:hypothetical protein|nr:DUF5063 domain-containing protein [Tannerella sp.]
MRKEENPVYDKNTLEFVTVALEFCSWLEKIAETDLFGFVDKATKLLPLLYLKAALLPEVEEPDEEDECDTSHFITEDTYDALRGRIAGLLGEYDSYLETFLPDMQYSDTPIIAFISENLADIYQDTGNFISLFRQGYEAVMLQSLALCRVNFRLFWGQSLLNALKALHSVRYNEELNIKEKEEE